MSTRMARSGVGLRGPIGWARAPIRARIGDLEIVVPPPRSIHPPATPRLRTGCLVCGYALLGYLGFLAISSVLIAFTTDWSLLPRTIDGPIRSAWPLALAVDLALLLGFGLQHSLMARPWFKQVFTRRFPEVTLRSSYVWASNLALLLLLLAWQPIGGTLWSIEEPAARLFLQIAGALGWLAAVACTFTHDHFEFFGLRQAWDHSRGLSSPKSPLREVGLYRFVRHPMMTFVMIALWLTPTMTVGHLLFVIAMSIYVVVGIHFEERSLQREFGSSYVDYKRRVPRFLPRVW